ncbi:MAG TPA: Maf family protein [Candidatus Binatia bacterium]|jgi:septum formation protein
MRSSADPGRAALVLASASPRRRWLLSALDVPFDVLTVDIDERPRAGEAPAAFARRMAREKALAGYARRGRDRPAWLLAADTIVELDGRIFGKPADADDAVTMLQALAGRTHVVRTALCLLDPDGGVAAETAVTTEVGFRALDAAAIRAYVATGEPLDKAGAYAIQGDGAALVAEVRGSFTNVIGLPLDEVAAWLRARGIG